MSLSINVDLTEFKAATGDLLEQLGGIAEILVGYLDDHVIPALQSEAGSQRNVITGRYSGDWESEQVDDHTAAVTTDADYWIYLEEGTSRGIKPKPVVKEVAENIPAELPAYLANALEVA